MRLVKNTVIEQESRSLSSIRTAMNEQLNWNSLVKIRWFCTVIQTARSTKGTLVPLFSIDVSLDEILVFLRPVGISQSGCRFAPRSCCCERSISHSVPRCWACPDSGEWSISGNFSSWMRALNRGERLAEKLAAVPFSGWRAWDGREKQMDFHKDQASAL